VIGVNSWVLSACEGQTLDAATNKVKSGIIYEATGLNGGIRVDALSEVIKGTNADDWIAINQIAAFAGRLKATP